MYEELEQRLLNCDSLESLECFQQYLNCIDAKNNKNDKLINEYKTILSTIITHQYLSLAVNMSQSNLHKALQCYQRITVNTINFSTLLFFEFSYNYGVTLTKVLGKEKEGLMKLEDALNILNTLPDSLANFLHFKVKKAIIIVNYNLAQYADVLSHIDQYLDSISIENTKGNEEEYEMLCAKATILFEIGEYSRTITIASLAISVNPNRGEAYYIRGSAKEKLYMKKEASADYSNVQNFNSSTYTKSDILNLSSLVKFDSYESLITPTSLLPGHISFEHVDVMEEDVKQQSPICYDESSFSLNLRSPIKNHHISNHYHHNNLQLGHISFEHVDVMEEDVKQQSPICYDKSSFSLNLRSPIKNHHISNCELSPIAVQQSKHSHRTPIALKTPKSNSIIGDSIPAPIRKNDSSEIPNSKHIASEDISLKNKYSSIATTNPILIEKATTNLKTFVDTNPIPKVETDKYGNFCIDEPLALSVAKPERHNPNSTYSINELTFPGPYPRDVDVDRREFYLSDHDFKQLLGYTKDQWKAVPPWKKKDLKKRFALF